MPFFVRLRYDLVERFGAEQVRQRHRRIIQ
jgi:hypothetical protein